jgi:hypothetical protein
LLAWAVIATHRYSYDGGFNTMARFVQFLVPALLALGLLPWLDSTGERRRPWILRALLSGTILLFIISAEETYRHDLHAPWIYVSDLWQHPEKRRWIFVEPNRVPSSLDRIAGPFDVIATDLTYQTWLHPLWGEDLTRKVLILHWQGDRAQIPDEAQWAVADNVASTIWGNGLNVRSAADLARARGWGQPTPRDSALYHQLLKNPHWHLVLANPAGNQCLFQRITPD